LTIRDVLRNIHAQSLHFYRDHGVNKESVLLMFFAQDVLL